MSRQLSAVKITALYERLCYLRDPEDKYHLVIDPESVAVTEQLKADKSFE